MNMEFINPGKLSEFPFPGKLVFCKSLARMTHSLKFVRSLNKILDARKDRFRRFRLDQEARFIEILGMGREPMDDPEIRDAVAGDSELEAQLNELRDFIGGFDAMQWPELGEGANIDFMTRAFEEGFNQGRRFAAEKAREPKWSRYFLRIVPVAASVVVGLVAGSFLWQGIRSRASVDFAGSISARMTSGASPAASASTTPQGSTIIEWP